MGQPIKSKIGAKYANGSKHSDRAAVVTFFTDKESKKTVAQLKDEELEHLTRYLIRSEFIPTRKANGFIASYFKSNKDGYYIEASTTCVKDDVFDETLGKKRALAKVLAKRAACTEALVRILDIEAANVFNRIKDKLIYKFDSVKEYEEYYEAFMDKKRDKKQNVINQYKELLRIQRIQITDMEVAFNKRTFFQKLFNR